MLYKNSTATLHSGDMTLSFDKVYLHEQQISSISNTGTVATKKFILYVFRESSSTPLESLNLDNIKIGTAYFTVNNDQKKYVINNYIKCLYGSYDMQHLEFELL